MNFIEINCGANDSGKRLDKIIKSVIPESNLSQIYSSIRKGLIKVNNKKAKAEQRLNENDVLKIADFLLSSGKIVSEGEKSNSSPYKFPYQIIFQNRHLLIINKPYDTTVHGSSDSIEKEVKEYFKAENSVPSLSFAPGPLHRLDRKTSGLLCFSWSIEGARWFSENIRTHQIKKYYTGVVEGILDKQETWEDYIDSENKNLDGNFYTVSISHEKNDDDDSKKALTVVTPLEHIDLRGKKFTVCQFQIFTGRTHQIRSQSSIHGHALAGDTAYGGKKLNSGRNFFLHATRLSIPENPLDIPLIIECPAEKELNEFLKNYE